VRARARSHSARTLQQRRIDVALLGLMSTTTERSTRSGEDAAAHVDAGADDVTTTATATTTTHAMHDVDDEQGDLVLQHAKFQCTQSPVRGDEDEHAHDDSDDADDADDVDEDHDVDAVAETAIARDDANEFEIPATDVTTERLLGSGARRRVWCVCLRAQCSCDRIAVVGHYGKVYSGMWLRGTRVAVKRIRVSLVCVVRVRVVCVYVCPRVVIALQSAVRSRVRCLEACRDVARRRANSGARC
jgi:hypothetical protein